MLLSNTPFCLQCLYENVKYLSFRGASLDATWESPGTIPDTAQYFDGWYQEIATGLTALAMTYLGANIGAALAVACNTLSREKLCVGKYYKYTKTLCIILRKSQKEFVDKCFQICDNITERTMKEVRKDGNFARRRCVAFMQCLSLRKVIKSKRVNAHEPPKGWFVRFLF